jgi:signal transduction histidine kinase
MSDQKVELELDLPPDLPKVRANPEQLMQVFLNLMANAIEAMPQGGRLTVAARMERLAEGREQIAPHLTSPLWGEGPGEGLPAGGSLPPANVVVIRFSDTGKGIAPENIGRVFEPGFTTKIQEGRVRGVGLGLYSARQIIKAHRGDITLQSELGVGTTVTVTLPAG